MTVQVALGALFVDVCTFSEPQQIHMLINEMLVGCLTSTLHPWVKCGKGVSASHVSLQINEKKCSPMNLNVK